MKLAVILPLLALTASPAFCQKPKPDSCEGVKNQLQKYVGKTVVFVGDFSRSVGVRGANGKQSSATDFWSCREGGEFAFDYSKAVWSDAAKRLKGPPMRVRGTVVGPEPKSGVAFIKDVTIDAP